MEQGELFKKCLGLRTLINTSVELEQDMVHYMAFDYKTQEFEVVMMAKTQMAQVAYWTFVIRLPYELLKRFMLLTEKMIKQGEKKFEGGKNRVKDKRRKP